MSSTPKSAQVALARISVSPSKFVVNETIVSAGVKEVYTNFRDLALRAYLERTPFAVQALDVLIEKGAKIVNDHVALRTFTDRQGIHGLKVLEQLFLAFGYKKEDNIEIPGLYLNCYWYEPPGDTDWPKVFISEQQVDKLPEEARNIIYKTVGSYYSSDPLKFLGLNEPQQADPQILYRVLEQPPWNPTASDYDRLLELSEEHPDANNALQYSAWTLVHAHRWNHYTVLLNALKLPQCKKLEDLNELLKKNGFTLNQSGGKEVQGSEDSFLKQSSTVANEVQHEFADGTKRKLPGSFVEFIERFMVKGQPVRGFLADNAKGIFTSTNASRSV